MPVQRLLKQNSKMDAAHQIDSLSKSVTIAFFLQAKIEAVGAIWSLVTLVAYTENVSTDILIASPFVRQTHYRPSVVLPSDSTKDPYYKLCTYLINNSKSKIWERWPLFKPWTLHIFQIDKFVRNRSFFGFKFPWSNRSLKMHTYYR